MKKSHRFTSGQYLLKYFSKSCFSQKGNSKIVLLLGQLPDEREISTSILGNKFELILIKLYLQMKLVEVYIWIDTRTKQG